MNRALAVVLLIVVMAFGSITLAQDTTTSVGEITADSAAWYGQTVTLEGNVDELVNIRSFVLGEGGLTNPQLLVVNRSGDEFPITLTAGAVVHVTGIIYPHYNDGGWNQILDLGPVAVTGETGTMAQADVMGQPDVTPDPSGAEAPMDATMTPGQTDAAQLETGRQRVGLDQFPVGILAERFPEHTILLVNSGDDIVVTSLE